MKKAKKMQKAAAGLKQGILELVNALRSEMQGIYAETLTSLGEVQKRQTAQTDRAKAAMDRIAALEDGHRKLTASMTVVLGMHGRREQELYRENKEAADKVFDLSRKVSDLEQANSRLKVEINQMKREASACPN